MRTINGILSDIITAVNAITRLPVKACYDYQSRLMDTPLASPVVTVGLNSVEANLDRASAYAGKQNGYIQYAVPTEVCVAASIYLPHTANGFVNYDVLTYIIEALFKSNITVNRISCGTMRYNSTFMCSVLPVTISLSERICEETGA